MNLISLLTAAFAAGATAFEIDDHGAFNCSELVAAATQPDFNITSTLGEISISNVTTKKLLHQCANHIPKNHAAGTSLNAGPDCDDAACTKCMTVCIVLSWLPPVWAICMGACAATACNDCLHCC